MVAFIAELFWLFEKVKPNFVQPRDSQGMRDGLGTKPCVSPVDPQDSILAWPERRKSPVSRSLYHHHHHQEPYSLHNTPPSEGVSFSLAGFSADPHLQTHHQGNTTPSLPRHHPPLLPQPPSGGAGLRALPGPCKAQGLLGHVYISDQESEVEEEELVLIVHPQRCPGGTPDTAPPPLGGTGYCVDRQAQESFYLEPLMPAVSRPAKEKSVSLNKQEESGETPTDRAGLLQRRGHPEADAPLDLLRATSSSTAITPAPWEQEEQEDSRCPSPCLSTASQASSSCSVTTTGAADSPGVRMTTFADRKLKKKNLKNCPGGGGVSSPTSSSQRTTPDDPDVTFPPAYPRGDHKPCWQGKESSAGLEKEGVVVAAGSPPVCSELVQLHMQLVEQQRAIEGQKKKMETAFTQQRLELGKAAFFNVIKKGAGKSDTLPRPPKRSPEVFPDILEWEGGRSKIHPSKDDSCLDEFSLKDGCVARGKMRRGQGQRGDNRLSPAGLAYAGGEPDLYGFCYSLENLNKSVNSIQQKIMQLSLQQSKLMKQGVAGTTPPAATPPDSGTPTKEAPRPPGTPPPAAAVSFSVGDFGSLDDDHDHDSGFGSTSTRSLGGRSPVTPAKHLLPPPPALTKPTELKLSREDSSKHSSTTATHQPPGRHRSTTTAVESTERETLEDAAFVKSPSRNSHRGSAFTVPCDTKSPLSYLRKGKKYSPFQPPVPVPVPVPVPAPVPRLPLPDEPLAVPPGPASQSEEEEEEDMANSSETSDSIGEETDRVESDVTDVDLSEEKVAADSDRHADDEQKNVLGFFYKHEEKGEDEMAKRRAAFLLKQERKAEEARLRKQQQEAENELKRDEARLKAEEDRVRKEEEKVRRELIKQEYLQRKRQELLEEQGTVKPRPKTLSARRPRLKSPQHPGSPLSKASPGRDEPTSSHRGSTLSLTAEPEDVVSGRSQRSYSRCSEDSFSVTSVDWDKRSTASFSLTADYNGPKLFKEPTSKSNKTIIINAVAHCCLAGKVNESQKNVVLEELEKCKANHLLILLRDGGCQYRGIYCYLSESEEIVKFLGTGPRTIARKMVDKLFKYSCDRKQFAVIHTKTLSITVDALTIHNHLWQVKRKGSLTLKK
ncbi:hypothetical protein CRUP_017838 [Coryphaenoides rupestris]|nr:hypothetical protein CRUP_017838 [Coryphaenoides rupestris]